MLYANVPLIAIAFAGILLYASLKQFIEKVHEILAKENLTDGEKSGAVGLLSALVLIGNVFAIVKAGSAAAVVAALFLMNLMLFAFKTALDWLVALYQNLPEYKNENP